MEVNYLIIALVIFAAFCLIFLLIRKNLKDKNQFEKDFYRSEVNPEKHNDNESRM
ncbi:hypothetical protein [Mucilaginibacter hurinus]|uniref:hypothetical protein n=1 Tax=Mucilaginibacter hurinus TaxID=2201324 RepID=UPI0018F5FB95|nr:hypothetical protein [Mucilaginibacter hurinus]